MNNAGGGCHVIFLNLKSINYDRMKEILKQKYW